MPLFKVFNGAEPTTAKRVAVATGTAIKTLLQLATPSTTQIKIVAWGIDFDGSAAATPGSVALITTDVAASSGTGISPSKFNDPNGPASLCVSGAALTCFSPSAEGTITVVRTLDAHLEAPTSEFMWEFSLGREPVVEVSKFLRVRVQFAATVNAVCWILFEE